MRIADLPVAASVRKALEGAGYDALYPSQEEAAPLAAQGKRLVVAVPTASGKSLVAYIALLERAAHGLKGMYIVPLRALAAEKHRELVALAEPMGLKVALAMGDLDRPDPNLPNFDIIVCTSEKADSLLRQRAHWVERLGCVVADEVHLLHDPGRGPTLEVLLARFRHIVPDAQIVALSATVANSLELASWLDAEHVYSEWRPVELKEGVHFGNAISFTDNSVREVPKGKDAIDALAADTLAEGGQAMVFVNTRKSAEAVAARLGSVTRPTLTPETAAALTDAVARLRAGESNQVKDKLLNCLEQGAAFHHAGLANAERTAVERLFLEGHLRALTATPTLAAGLNLPARRVIIRDLFRFDSDLGRVPIPVLEYKQMAGRAGRPRFDPYGEAITLAKTMDEKEEITFRYLLSGPEAIESKLAQEWAMRVHILSTIASGYATTEQGVHEFIGQTFYAHQGSHWTIEHRVERTLDFLVEEGFVKEDKGLRPTPFGSLTSDLYIDPASAVILRDALKAAAEREDEPRPIELLHAVAATPDLPGFYLRSSDAWIEEEAHTLLEDLLVPYERRTHYDQYLSEVKTALVLHAWIDERSDEEIMQRFGAYPGDVHGRVDSARWLLHASRELSRLFNPAMSRPVTTLAMRVRHGAKEELLPILKLRGVGRYRARNLFRAGFRTPEALRDADPQALLTARGVGPGLVRSLKAQLGGDVDAVPEAPTAPAVQGQVSLGHFGGRTTTEGSEDTEDREEGEVAPERGATERE